MTARRIGSLGSRWLAAALLAAVTSAASADDEPGSFTLVPEMERPAGILYQSRSERQALEREDDGGRGLEAMERHVRELWPQVRSLDLVELSRHQVEATRGYRLPAAPGDLQGRAIARDEDGIWYLELRGPRLPARYDIVYRYLYFYTSYDPVTGQLGELVVTIRGWVEE